VAHDFDDHEGVGAGVSEASTECMSQVVKTEIEELRVFAGCRKALLNVA